MDVMDDEVLVELDERRRVSLGRIGRPEHRRYLVSVEADGTIVMKPAVVMSELEARFLGSEVPGRVRANERDPSLLVRHAR